MSVVQIVADHSNADMQDNIYSWYAEDDKRYNRQRIHFTIEEPDESETETRPVPGNTEFLFTSNRKP